MRGKRQSIGFAIIGASMVLDMRSRLELPGNNLVGTLPESMGAFALMSYVACITCSPRTPHCDDACGTKCIGDGCIVCVRVAVCWTLAPTR